MTHVATRARHFVPHKVEAVVEQFRDTDDLTYLVEYQQGNAFALVSVYDQSGLFLGYL